MLLKFSSSDILNTDLIDLSKGQIVYTLTTHHLPPCAPSLEPTASTSPSRCTTTSTQSTQFVIRRTLITNPKGVIIAEIGWNNRKPCDIVLEDEKLSNLIELFGSSTVRFMPKILAIPTRFDTEYIWTATPDSLTLFDYDTDTAKGQFHQNALRIADKWINPRLPGLGHHYLEFDHHPLASPIEIIVSFLMMEIMRRGRFSLTPYIFPTHRTKFWKILEARDIVIQKLRRNTL